MPPKHNPQFTLPLELIGEILQPLSIWDLGRCERVSRDWQAACRDIWLQLAKRLLVSTDLPFAELKMQVHGATNKTTSYAFGRWILTFEPGVSITIQHIKFQLGICYRVRAPPHSHAVDPEDIEILIQTKLATLWAPSCRYLVRSDRVFRAILRKHAICLIRVVCSLDIRLHSTILTCAISTVWDRG
eukprot:TRINITY_DN1150_c0_g1_i1.p1 TRINITY_DN1150_c0_g1~~TRINITY_DN1150_c0_g1_i1.p1  ORF type:complete len:187 (-),score=3.75 TRINITY_DN1150_c0_g1_i1:539-1099(-)